MQQLLSLYVGTLATGFLNVVQCNYHSIGNNNPSASNNRASHYPPTSRPVCLFPPSNRLARITHQFFVIKSAQLLLTTLSFHFCASNTV